MEPSAGTAHLSVSVWTRRTSGLRTESLSILETARATPIQPESDSLVSEDDEDDDEEEESEEELLALRRDGWAWTSDAGVSFLVFCGFFPEFN